MKDGKAYIVGRRRILHSFYHSKAKGVMGEKYKKKEEKKVMNRKGIEMKKESSKKLVTVVMAAMIVSAVMTAFIAGAAAAGTVTNFEITPKTVPANTTSGYNVIVNTTGFENPLTINITLPAGFSVANDTMQSDDELARIDIYNTSGWFADVIFTANATNPQTEVKVAASDGSDIIYTVKTVNYGPGVANKTTITAEHGSTNLSAEMILPTATVNGSVNASINLPIGQNITNVSISIEPFVRSPETVGNYTFVAKVNGQENTSTVKVAPVYTYTMHLLPGLNLISIPLYDPTVKKASELATKIGANCTVVTKWDAVNQGYVPYIATLGIYEFDTVGGQGYFVSVTDATDVTFSGTPWSD